MFSNLLLAIFFIAVLNIAIATFKPFQEFQHNTQLHQNTPKVWYTYVAKFIEKVLTGKKQYFSCQTLQTLLQTKSFQSKQFKDLVRKFELENCGSSSYNHHYAWCFNMMTHCLNLNSSHPKPYQIDVSRLNISKPLTAVTVDKHLYTRDGLLFPDNLAKEKNHSLCSIFHHQGRKEAVMRECLRFMRPLQKPTGWFLCNRSHLTLLYFDPIDSDNKQHHHSCVRKSFFTHARLVWQLRNPHIDATFMIVVESLIFPSVETNHCYNGFFQIIDNKNMRNLKFCGVHSAFHIFTPFYNSTLIIDSERVLLFSIQAYLSLTDRQILSQVLPEQKSHLHLRLAFFLQGQMQTLGLQTYHIVVEKIYIVKMWLSHSNKTQNRIQNGPTYFTSPIVPCGPFVKCSTFQCHIAVLSVDLNVYQVHGSKYLLKYTSERFPHTKLCIEKSGRQFHFDGAPDTDQAFGTILQAGPGFQLKITIFQMIFQGVDHIKCLHGGITFYDQYHSIQEEVLALCSTDSGERNIYSKGSEMFFFLYQYKGHNKVVTHILASLTQCKSTIVYPSSISNNCCPSFWSSKSKHRKCKFFLKNISSSFITFSKLQDFTVNYFITNTTQHVLFCKSGRLHPEYLMRKKC